MEANLKDFFDNQKEAVENRKIFIHPAGYQTKIKHGVDYDYNKVWSGKYDGSPFQDTKVKDLPGQIARLDQLLFF